MAGISKDKGWDVLGTGKVAVTETQQVIKVSAFVSASKFLEPTGMEILNSGEETVYIGDSLNLAVDTDDYPLAPGERIFLTGSCAVVTGAGITSELRILVVG